MQGMVVRISIASSTELQACVLEIASTIRNDNDLRAAFIENLAYAIGAFAARYGAQSAPMGSRSFIPNPCGLQAG